MYLTGARMCLRQLKLNLTPASRPLMSHDVCSFLEEPPKPDLEPEFFPRVESPFNVGRNRLANEEG